MHPDQLDTINSLIVTQVFRDSTKLWFNPSIEVEPTPSQQRLNQHKLTGQFKLIFETLTQIHFLKKLY